MGFGFGQLGEVGTRNQLLPQLFRFGLRQFFVFISSATLLFALLARLGGVWPIVVGCAAALVMAHVFSTFVGTRLRDTSQELQQWRGRCGSLELDSPIALLQPVRLADFQIPETTPLAFHTGPPRPGRLPVYVGLALGAVVGVAGLAVALPRDATWAGLVLGGVSCSVMGAWIGFIASSFYAISRHALRHATRDVPQQSLAPTPLDVVEAQPDSWCLRS